MIFKGLSVPQNCLRPDSAPLIVAGTYKSKKNIIIIIKKKLLSVVCQAHIFYVLISTKIGFFKIHLFVNVNTWNQYNYSLKLE